MNIATLLESLCGIERAIENGDNPPAIHAMVIEAEDQLLQLQREVIDAEAEADLLRRCVENARRSSLFRLRCPCITEAEASEMPSPVAPAAAGSNPDHASRPRFVN